jgi:ABC-2 type transport system permease protein
MIVMSDGDLARNDFALREGYSLPMGYDQYSRQTFGNRDLILNAVNYLCDESGLISVRSRELKLRLLDQTKVLKERVFWQILNILLPVVLILVFGIIKYRLRKTRYAGLPAPEQPPNSPFH